MYGNASFRDDGVGVELTAEQRKHLRRELSVVAARTRELLPSEFVVGSELTAESNGPRATVAVQPPVGAPVSANYVVEDEIDIGEDEREDIAVGLAASAALQVKQAFDDDRPATAR